MSPSTSTTANSAVPTFASLGVSTLINGMGTYTRLSGSRMIRQAADAMVEASNHYVVLDQLMDAVGERLAQLTGAEWGYVTCGCAAGLTQLTAACIAGGDPEKMTRLPDTCGMPNEVIMQSVHRNSYDWSMRMVGAQIVEVVTRAELQAALSERAALVAITGDFEERSTIPIPEMIAIAHEHGTPTLVDAAAQRPDVPNRYLEMGADAVLYSGGKCLRGPQASGLVLGRKDLLQTAYLHSAPHHALGRPMKAGKEEIMGLLAAYEAWLLGRDHEAEWRMWEEDLERIRAAVAEFPSVQTQIEQPGLANHAPSLVITWDLQEIGATPDMVDLMLREQDPPIHVHCLESGLRIMPYMLERGDSEIIADRLQEILERLTGTTLPHGTTSVDVEVSGDWTVDIAYTLGASTHAMRLEQAEDQLMGRYRSQYACETIKGNVRGHDVEFKVTLGCEANRVTYYFRGTAEGDGIEGTVALGEYGSANWTARRVANDA